MQRNTTIASQKRKKKKLLSQKQILMIGLGSGVAFGIGFLAYNHFKNRAAINRGQTNTIINPPDQNIPFTPNFPTTTNNEFPLKKGSRGTLVQMLQQALLNKGGQASLIIRETSFRNGKTDGIFGNGTQRALQAAGLPSVITQSQFSSLVGRTPSGFNPSAIAKELIIAANKQNLFGVLNGLKKITNTTQYRQVSSFFKNVRIIGIRVTSLVNALLSVAFKNKTLEKVKIRSEFRRMGLQQNSRGIWFIPEPTGRKLGIGNIGTFTNHQQQIENEWSLAIARKPMLLQSEDGSFILPEVIANTVIGYITGIQNGITRILTQNGETVYAPTQNLSMM